MSAAATPLPATLPSPPAGLAMIIQATGDPKVGSRALATMISREPSFTAEMIRLANSPVYGSGRAVRSVQQATMLMGMRQIRNMALAHAVRSTTANVDTGAFDRDRFWEDSLRRATACQTLAQRAGYPDPTEAFTVGLLQDIGVLLLAIMHPEHGGSLQDAMCLPGQRRIEQERALFGMTHSEVALQQAERWSFPEALAQAIAYHHDEAPASADRSTKRLTELARAAEAIADIGQTEAAGNTVARATRMLHELPSRQELQLEEICDAVGENMRSAASDMRIRIDEQASFQDLMARANESLLSVNAGYEELTRKLEQLLAEKEDLTRKLQNSNQELFRLATTDPLTHLLNRRAFMDALRKDLYKAESSTPQQPLSLLMLDIDHFKRVNDTWGHAAGDAVIKSVAAVLKDCTRDVDRVGRLGGEEFAVLLAGTDEHGARIVAERIRRAIEASVVRTQADPICVTASAGGATVSPGGVVPTPDGLLNAADTALYASKERGRNRVSWSR
jgi:two-component system cell cycle response regulator